MASEIKLYNRDCLEAMKEMPDKAFDLAIVDPPYGIGMDKGFGGTRKFGSKGMMGGMGKTSIPRRQYKGDWDSERPSKEYFDSLIRVSKLIMCFGGNFFADLLPQGTHWLFWDKLNTMPTFSDGELIYTNSERKSVKRLLHEYNGLIGKEEQERFHPCQKPVDLYRKILNIYAPPMPKSWIRTLALDPSPSHVTTWGLILQDLRLIRTITMQRLSVWRIIRSS